MTGGGGGGEGGGRPAAGNGASTSPALQSPDVVFFCGGKVLRERCARPREMTRRTSSPGRSATLSLSGFQFRPGRGGSSVFCRGARCRRTSSCSRRRWPRGVWPRFQSATVHLHLLHLLEPRGSSTRNTKNDLDRPSGGGGRGRRWSRAEFEIFQAPASSRSNHQPWCDRRTQFAHSFVERTRPSRLSGRVQTVSNSRLDSRQTVRAHTVGGGRTHTLNHSRARPIFPCPVAWSRDIPRSKERGPPRQSRNSRL